MDPICIKRLIGADILSLRLKRAHWKSHWGGAHMLFEQATLLTGFKRSLNVYGPSEFKELTSAPTAE